MSLDLDSDLSELRKKVLGLKQHSHPQKVNIEDPSKLKRNHSEIVAEIYSLED